MSESSGTSSVAAKPWALILAAGQGTRMADATGGTAKRFLPWQGAPLFWHAARAMSRSACVAGIVFVFLPASLPKPANFWPTCTGTTISGCRGLLPAAGAAPGFRAPWPGRPAPAPRQRAGARCACFFPPALVRRVCEALAEGAAGVIPAISVTDTIKMVDNGRVTSTLPRDGLAAVQTPQGFQLDVLLSAHAHAVEAGLAVTDDASLLEALGLEVRVIQGRGCQREDYLS